MPLYEYQCKACGIRFERRQHITDDPIEVCPECGGEVYRLIHPVGIIFKGKGFYVTDNRARSSTAVPRGSHKPSKAAEASETSESKSSESEAASESKSTSDSSASTDTGKE